MTALRSDPGRYRLFDWRRFIVKSLYFEVYKISIKKMKNVSEIIYLTVFLFFVSTLFDIFNPHYIGSIFRSPARLLTSFPFWESLMGLFTLAFGLKVYFRYFEANKLFSALECENFRKGPKRETSDKYLSWEEYEKNAEKAPLGAPKTIYETPYMETRWKRNL